VSSVIFLVHFFFLVVVSFVDVAMGWFVWRCCRSVVSEMLALVINVFCNDLMT
jgi:hypothetical protein